MGTENERVYDLEAPAIPCPVNDVDIRDFTLPGSNVRASLTGLADSDAEFLRCRDWIAGEEEHLALGGLLAELRLELGAS